MNTRVGERKRRPGESNEEIWVRNSRNGNTDKFKEMVVRLSVGTTPQILTFLVDTCSQRSFISYREHEDKLQSQLVKTSTPVRMFGIGGSELNVRGKVAVPIHIGTEVVIHDILIADVEEEAILGYNFMKKH